MRPAFITILFVPFLSFSISFGQTKLDCLDGITNVYEVSDGQHGAGQIVDNTLYIGESKLKNLNNISSGAVVIYELSNTIVAVDTIFPSQGANNERFGQWLIVQDTVMVVYARNTENNEGEDTGAHYVYKYRNSVWEEVQIIYPEKGEFQRNTSFYNNYLFTTIESQIGESILVYEYLNGQYVYAKEIIPEVTEQYGFDFRIDKNQILINDVAANVNGFQFAGKIDLYNITDSLELEYVSSFNSQIPKQGVFFYAYHFEDGMIYAAEIEEDPNTGLAESSSLYTYIKNDQTGIYDTLPYYFDEPQLLTLSVHNGIIYDMGFPTSTITEFNIENGLYGKKQLPLMHENEPIAATGGLYHSDNQILIAGYQNFEFSRPALYLLSDAVPPEFICRDTSVILTNDIPSVNLSEDLLIESWEDNCGSVSFLFDPPIIDEKSTNPTAVTVVISDGIFEMECSVNVHVFTDLDGDGYTSLEDCDDTNPDINPNQVEEPYNGLDDDCDPTTPDDDLDQDGFNNDLDCNDDNPNINPDQIEEPYNGLDDDCDPTTLDDDLDQDGFNNDLDCDDNDPNINPDAEEIANNGIDEDCDGMDLVTSVHDISGISLIIYPNPTSDIISIEFSDHISFQANLFNLNGKLIRSQSNAHLINVRDIQIGTYILEIKDLNSDQKIIERISVIR